MSADRNEALRLADELIEEADRRVCHIAMAPASLLKDSATELRSLIAANRHMKDLTDQALSDIKASRDETTRVIALLDAANAERDQLRAEVERLKPNAERYQWLKAYDQNSEDMGICKWVDEGWSGQWVIEHDPDSAIDHARTTHKDEG